MRYLVDSDWIVDFLKGRSHAVHLLEALLADGMAISIVTYAEVFEASGAYSDTATTGPTR